MPRPERKIFFEVKDRPNLKIQIIECKETNRLLQRKQLDPNLPTNGMGFEGPICPSNKYIIYFGENKSVHFLLNKQFL